MNNTSVLLVTLLVGLVFRIQEVLGLYFGLDIMCPKMNHCPSQACSHTSVQCSFWNAAAFFHILSYPFISYHILSYPFVSFHILSYRFISFHILSHPFMSFHILSYPFTSFHILSYPFVSFHMPFIIFYH